jgi:hypothetical protein
MTDEEKRPGFWHTFPGILTAIATVITALTGFIGALYQAGVSNDADKLQSQPQNMATKKLGQLAGSYYVHGKNPNGTLYVGEATIKHKGDHYEIVWKIGNQKYYGTGAPDDNLFRVKWEHGLVTYIIRENGALDGSWADGQGTETLTPYIDN